MSAHRLRRARALLPAAAALALTACATTRHAETGEPPTAPLCQLPGEPLTALVLWGPHWRADQKEPLLREAAAQRGIDHFFSTGGCFRQARVVRKLGEREAIGLGAEKVRALAEAMAPRPDRVLSIAVRELGPVLKLGSPALVEGGTEVVLDIRALSPATGQPVAAFTTHWQHGGAWVVKGVATLEQDMAAALGAALKPAAVPREP